MITENLSTLKIHKLTKEQYDRELEAGRIDETALYLTPDEEIDLSGYATVDQLDGKANTQHTHAISDVTNLQASLDGKADKSHNHDAVYETKSDATNKLNEAKSYADGIKDDLLNGAGGAYDTLKELGDLIDENTDAIQALEQIAVGKADSGHTHDERYFTKEQIDDIELISVNDIDTICGSSIQFASLSEVTF